MMSLARPISLALLAVAIMAYAFDCGATITPEQAMQCCNSMPCSSHGHQGQDCCKTMPTMHAPFVQAASLHGAAFSPVMFAVLPASGEAINLDSTARSITAHCHAPPGFDLPSPQPLRI
jgi:hypothetical protein